MYERVTVDGCVGVVELVVYVVFFGLTQRTLVKATNGSE